MPGRTVLGIVMREVQRKLAAQVSTADPQAMDAGPGRSVKQVIIDLGCRGVNADNPGVQIIHRGKYKSLSDHEKRLLKRRQAIEPLIGHTKADHRMERCWLQGALGDALHAISCAAGYNIRWLLRVIAWVGFFAPSRLWSRASQARCEQLRRGPRCCCHSACLVEMRHSGCRR